MPYPFSYTDPASGITYNTYADIPSVTAYFTTYDPSIDVELGVIPIWRWLQTCTSEIDAVLLKRGFQVPPPAGAIVLPILRETCAIGTSAMIEQARYEGGDDRIGSRVVYLAKLYDAQLGLFERDDINGLLMGLQTAGWASQADETKYFSNGNTQQFPNGDTRGPQFTMNMDF